VHMKFKIKKVNYIELHNYVQLNLIKH